MKRATRQFLKNSTSGEFKTLSNEWREHLRWMKYRLAYFRSFRPGSPNLRRTQRQWIDLLVSMAKTAIAAERPQITNEKLLRDIIRRFVHDCRRRRVGERNFLYMLKNQEDPIAQAELLKYVAPRLGWEEGLMAKNRGRATVDSTPPTKQVEVPRKQAPIVKPPVQVAVAPSPPVHQPKAFVAKKAFSNKVVLPPRPDPKARPNAIETRRRELAEFLIEFFKTVGSTLGLQYPADLPSVLRDLRKLMNDLPTSGQAIGVVPMGDARSAFFKGISLGALDCDRQINLATGLRNLMKALGGSRSTWEDALGEVDPMRGKMASDLVQNRQSTSLDVGFSEQQASLPGVLPVRRPVEFGIVVPGFRRRQ
ncbi:hypothetical protein P8935_14090 [Telmatobacter sp. DSM 110680]|uniref:Uncharacterized protein n=1 Tax=Telmatobacter sp. DSM 110680 TaxID=3036704 RepID=A0AAU7DDH4_9BACT